MDRPPLVSVIMPAYNTSRYVERAVRSAMAQTVREIEVLVVDDGSTDRTFAAALECARGDRRVQVLTQTNAGPSAARNRAMRMAKGAFFALLDSDDEWLPGFLEVQLAVFRDRQQTAVVTANAINRGSRLDGTPYRPIESQPRRLSFVDMVRREDAVCILSVFRRSVYDTIGPFDERLRTNEDYEFWLRTALRGFEFVQTFEPLAYYCRRPDNATTNDHRMAAGILRVFRMVREQCRTDEERATVDAQIARYERELIGIEARNALRRSDFTTAEACYATLHERSGDRRAAALLLAARHTPRLLLWAANARRSMRRAAQSVTGSKKTISRKRKTASGKERS